MTRPDDLDPVAVRHQIERVLGGLRPTRSQADRRLRQRLVDAWTHLNRGGDPQTLVDGLSDPGATSDTHAA